MVYPPLFRCLSCRLSAGRFFLADSREPIADSQQPTARRPNSDEISYRYICFTLLPYIAPFLFFFFLVLKYSVSFLPSPRGKSCNRRDVLTGVVENKARNFSPGVLKNSPLCLSSLSLLRVSSHSTRAQRPAAACASQRAKPASGKDVQARIGLARLRGFGDSVHVCISDDWCPR